MKKTSIIIPTYNSRELLKDCLYAIKQHTKPTYEIIVVDNGSTDGTLDTCRQEGISFISLPRNYGFPTACNKGLRVASGDTLLLLNNDVFVTSHWLESLLNCLYSAEDIGIVGPVTNYASGKQQVEMPAELESRRVEPSTGAAEEKWQETERIVGMCFLFKRSVMERIGELDERFSPGHFEDDDYCMRARNAGFKLRIAGNVFVYHHGSASFGRQEESQVKHLIETNRLKFIAKWNVDPAIYV